MEIQSFSSVEELRKQEIRRGRKRRMSSSKTRCLELYQLELSLGLNSCLQNVEKVIHIYNERLWLYRECLLKSMGGFPLAPPSFGSGQLSMVSLLGQETSSVTSQCSGAHHSSAVPGMNSKRFPNHHSHFYSLARFSDVSFTVSDNMKRTSNSRLARSCWQLNREGFSCIGVWGEDLAKSVSSPSGALAVQEFLSHISL